MNAINIIAPHKYLGMWVFDDPRKSKNTSTVLTFILSIASCLPAELISVPASAF
jgi:hypothetical protein